MKRNNPHDKFFKETFSNKEEAIDLLRNALPKQILKNVDLNTLRLDNTSYVDEKLKESFSDLVFDCKYQGETDIKISILIEHKSYAPDYPHIQLLKYMINVWEANIKQKQTLIPVIPVIFYHGKQKWKSRKFSDYFKGIDRNIEIFLPSFNYLLTDLSSFSEKEIRDLYKAMTVQISLLLMKGIFNEEQFEKNIFRIFTGIDLLAKTERGEKFLTSTMMYMYYSTEIEPDTISKILTKVSTKGGEIAMTTAMKLRRKGMQEGMQKGKSEKAIEIAKKMLPKMSIKDISDLTGLPKEEIIKIKRSMLLDQKKTDVEN